MPLYECIACNNQRRGRLIPIVCDGCGRTSTYAILDCVPVSRAIRAADIELADIERYATGDESLDSVLLGGLAIPSTVTVFGTAGVGKSRSSLRWATRSAPCLLISLEMPAELAALSAREARANLDNLYVTESEEDWQSEAAKVGAKVVILDSYQYSQKQRAVRGSRVPLVCHELSEWSKRSRGVAILIAHINKKGRVSGTTAAEHWPDYLFKFERFGSAEAKIIVSKARYSPSGSAVVTI